MSLISDTLRIKKAKEDMKKLLDENKYTPVSENDLLGTYASHISDACDDIETELSVVEDSIQTKTNLIASEKSAIKMALENRGVTVPSSAEIEDYPSLISGIPFSMVPVKSNITSVSIDTDGVCTYDSGTNYRTDIYEIENGVTYFCSLGATTGSHFMISACQTDPSTLSSGSISGTKLYGSNTAPSSYDNTIFAAPFSGYLAVMKDNNSTDGIPVYLVALY